MFAPNIKNQVQSGKNILTVGLLLFLSTFFLQSFSVADVVKKEVEEHEKTTFKAIDYSKIYRNSDIELTYSLIQTAPRFFYHNRYSSSRFFTSTFIDHFSSKLSQSSQRENFLADIFLKNHSLQINPYCYPPCKYYVFALREIVI